MLLAELQSWLVPAGACGDEVAEGVVNRALVLAALASLSEADQELVVLVAWHSLTPGQAAAVLCCSRSAFFVRLHRARRRLELALRARPAGRPATVAVPARTPLPQEVSR